MSTDTQERIFPHLISGISNVEIAERTSLTPRKVADELREAKGELGVPGQGLCPLVARLIVLGAISITPEVVKRSPLTWDQAQVLALLALHHLETTAAIGNKIGKSAEIVGKIIASAASKLGAAGNYPLAVYQAFKLGVFAIGASTEEVAS